MEAYFLTTRVKNIQKKSFQESHYLYIYLQVSLAQNEMVSLLLVGRAQISFSLSKK